MRRFIVGVFLGALAVGVGTQAAAFKLGEEPAGTLTLVQLAQGSRPEHPSKPLPYGTGGTLVIAKLSGQVIAESHEGNLTLEMTPGRYLAWAAAPPSLGRCGAAHTVTVHNHRNTRVSLTCPVP